MRTESDPRDQPGRWVLVNRVGPGWFRTRADSPARRTRLLTFDDRAGAPRVVIVNETAARQFWNGDALGKRLDDAEVVGVVAGQQVLDARRRDPAHGLHRVYQRPESGVTIFLRTSDWPAPPRRCAPKSGGWIRRCSPTSSR